MTTCQEGDAASGRVALASPRGLDAPVSGVTIESVHDALRPLLQQRMRIGLGILAIACPLFGVGDLLFHRTVLVPLLLLKLVYLAAIVQAAISLRRPRAWATLVRVALHVVAMVSVVTALSNALVEDVPTTFLLATLLTLGTATILPWGPRPQLATAALAGLAMAWNAVVLPGMSFAHYPPACAALLAGITSVYVAGAFERHRLVRAQIEATLRESEARKGSILDAALDCIVTLDHEGRIVDLNPAAELTFRCSREAVLGRPMDDLLVLGPRWPAVGPGDAVTDGGRLALGRRIETTVLRSDGSAFPAELAVVAIARPGPPLFTAYIRDLTERKLAEEARASAALVRIGAEMMQLLDTEVVLDRLGVVVRELLGAERTFTLLRLPQGERFVIARGHGPAGRGWLREATLSSLLGRIDADGLLELADPAEETLPAPVRALLGPARRALCIALWSGDVVQALHVATFDERTEPFNPQERRIGRGVSQIASMALTNARLVEELADASRVKTEFLSTMSHELRTPIHVVLGYADMAADLDLPLPERAALLGRITVAGRELLDLVEGTLDVARFETGRSEVQLEAVPLGPLWAGIRAGCEELRRRPDVPVVWTTDVPEITVHTDVRKLAAIVRNLVSNACKFTDRGHVDVDLTVGGGWLRLVVADTGIGIPAGNRNAVFEMFRQGDGSETRRHQGAGLGLYVVRRFVEQLSGTVSFTSTPGIGTTFTVTLPLRPPPAPAALPAEPVAAVSRATDRGAAPPARPAPLAAGAARVTPPAAGR